MKKKLLLVISLVAVLGIGISVAVFSASGEESDFVKELRAAMQAYKRICNADVSLDTDTLNSNGQTVVGYYKEIPITRDQVIYKQALNRTQRNPEDPTWRIPEKTEKELIFEVAQDLYTYEQARELGLYPSEEEMEEEFALETESFQRDLEENLEICSQIGCTQDEWIAWMTQRRIENIAKTRFMTQTLISLQEGEEIDDEVLAELVHALVVREDGVDLLSTLDKLFDRYVTLQVGEQITYVKEDTGEASDIVSE